MQQKDELRQGSTLVFPAGPVPSFDMGAVAAFLNHLNAKQLQMHSYLIAHHGQVVSEGYWSPYTVDTAHRLYSVSKSFVSLAVGCLVDRRVIRLTDLICDHFPEYVSAETPEEIRAMTVEHLLTMSSAHKTTTYKQCADTDWVRTFFTLQPTQFPGILFSYDTSATVVLTALVEKVSRQRLVDFLWDSIFHHLGFDAKPEVLYSPRGLSPSELNGQPPYREVKSNPEGVSHGGSGISCTTRDLAKIAQLCMNQGRWGDDQLISSDYMRRALTYQVGTHKSFDGAPDDASGYGYQFWINRNGNGFSMKGMGGQVALCVPEADLLLVTTADLQSVKNYHQIIADGFWEYLYPAAATSALGEPRSDINIFNQFNSNLPGVDHERSHLENYLNGKRFEFSMGTLPMSDVVLTFHETGGQIDFTSHLGSINIAYGFNSEVSQRLPIYGYNSRFYGFWVDEKTLFIRGSVDGDFLASIEIIVGFMEGRVEVEMRKAAENFLNEFEGHASGKISQTSNQ